MKVNFKWSSIIFCLFLMGCETLPILPEKSAIYYTANGNYTVENTTDEEFCNKFVTDKTIIKAYYNGTEMEGKWD